MLVAVEDCIKRQKRETPKLALVFVVIPCLPEECLKPFQTACCPSVRDETTLCRPLAYTIYYQTMPYALPVACGPIWNVYRTEQASNKWGQKKISQGPVRLLAHDKSPWLHSYCRSNWLTQPLQNCKYCSKVLNLHFFACPNIALNSNLITYSPTRMTVHTSIFPYGETLGNTYVWTLAVKFY